MNRTNFFTLIFLVFSSLSGLAQVDTALDQLRTVVPPSPNASSLGKFGEWPVSLYTGLPDISVPIYTLKSRSLSVPISLSYHPAGVRVGELASWVGLGWALNAGGVITRSVRGDPDEETYFTDAKLFSNKNNFCSTFLNDTTYFTEIGRAANGNMDFQQDTYSLNALGKNYRIYFDADSLAHTMPASNIQITRNFLGTSDNSWTLVMEDGTTLVFGGSVAGYGPCYDMTSGANFGTELVGESYVSAWYLKSITAITGEQINFTYTSETILQDTHFTQSDKLLYNETTAAYSTYAGINTKCSQLTLTQLRLNTISSDLATIYLIPATSQRQDLPGAYALSEIKVYSNLTSSYVDDWLFNSVYSTATSGNGLSGVPNESAGQYNCRLKLMSLEQKPMDGTSPIYWYFGYNPTTLPSRFSYAQDHWGFYNGQLSNTSLLEPVPFIPQSLGDNVGFFNSGFDVHAANEQFMQAEMLDTITYPTGGKTVFTYEGNSQMANQNLVKDTTVPLNINNVGGGSGPYVDTVIYSFFIPRAEYVFISLSSTISSAILHDYTQAKVNLVITDSLQSFGGILSSGSSWSNLFFPGHYKLQLQVNVPDDEFINSSYYVTASASMRYLAYEGNFNLKQELGGVRVNNISSYDGISSAPILSKSFVYSNPFVIYPMDTVNSYLTIQDQMVDNGLQTQVNTTRFCATKYSLGSIQGGTVGYGQVTTNDGPNGSNGYTISTFGSGPATGLAASLVFPYPPIDQKEWRNGLLLNETAFTATGIPVKSKRNTYAFVQQDQVQNVAIGYSTLNLTTCGAQQYNPLACGTSVICYTNTNEEIENLTSTDVTYDATGADSVVLTKTYYYDNANDFSPTRDLMLDSKGDTVWNYTRRALEESTINSSIPLTGAALAAIDTMQNHNVVGPVIEKEQYHDGTLVDKTLVNYGLNGSNVPLPANVMIQDNTNPIETRLYLKKYDAKGNLTEQAKSADLRHDYIYDYLSNYPIAECEGADSFDIAYTSFEADGYGNWSPFTGTITTLTAPPFPPTGTKYYHLTTSATLSKSGLVSGNTYIISYWSGNGVYSITGGTSTYTTGKTIGVWVYYEHKVTATSTTLTISGTGVIDEVRLYPVGAQMTTYTYAPLIGMTSQCDVDNRATYYFYDGYNRLRYIKDQDGNIVKTIQYHYMNQ